VAAAPRPAPAAHSAAPVEAAPSEESSPAPVRAELGSNRKLEPARLDLLQAESALVMQARAELRSGNPAGAQTALDKLQAQFPKGMLAQEREVLAIEVLAARGNAAAARQRARAFVRSYPKSPHSQKLARFLEWPPTFTDRSSGHDEASTPETPPGAPIE
jgi:predicted Zn-dependent protease